MCAWMRLLSLPFLIYATTSLGFVPNPIDNFNNGATDHYLKIMITHHLQTDPIFANSQVTVASAQNGNVVLKGQIPNDVAAFALISLTESFPTTTGVNANDLEIISPTLRKEDVYTAAMVTGLCLRKMIFSPQDIQSGLVKVVSSDQRVDFTGVARSQFQIDRAIEAAKTLPFVKKVNSTMTVQ
jgi:osmotically-inducible protein OsmY